MKAHFLVDDVLVSGALLFLFVAASGPAAWAHGPGPCDSPAETRMHMVAAGFGDAAFWLRELLDTRHMESLGAGRSSGPQKLRCVDQPCRAVAGWRPGDTNPAALRPAPGRTQGPKQHIDSILTPPG